MGLNGQLQQMPFGEIFQTISLCKQSGVLTLTCDEKRGRLVFSQGCLLSAAVDSLAGFGQALMQKGVLSEKALEQALALQRTGNENLPLGEVLKNSGLVSEDVLQVELKKYLVEVVKTLLGWNDGSFHFEFGPASNTEGMLLNAELNLPSLLMEATRPKEIWQEGLFESVESPARRGEWERFLSMLSELLGPIHVQEAVLLVLRYASEVFHQTLLFIVKEKYLLGVGQSGLPFPEEDADRWIQGLRIPLSAPSLFKETVDRKETYKGVMPQQAVHQSYIDQIGGEWPSEIFLAPLLAGDEVIALLYGDQGSMGGSFPDTRGLEAFIRMTHAVTTKLRLEREVLVRRGGRE